MVSLFSREVVRVPDGAALVLAPVGVLVEQLSGDPVDRSLAELQGGQIRETLLPDVVRALDAAADDDRIPMLILDLRDFDGAGLSKLQDVAAAIGRFREAGKPVVAMGDAYTQAQYYLAAQADKVYMHPFGSVLLEGFGYYRAFFRSALDKLRIDVNVFRVGEYKSFVEPFLRDDMSDADKEASARWLNALWSAYRFDIAARRSLEAGDIDTYSAAYADRTEAAGGDLARVAVESGLVDELLTRGEFTRRMIDEVGSSDYDLSEYRSIDYRDYLKAVDAEPDVSSATGNVGVLVASGDIVDGEAPPGTIGGDTLAAMIRSVAADESIDALVLRVDSPGGSMMASEVVYQELRTLQESGLPLVVSMGSVAASGGYYISMPADRIFAAKTTITGSIGVGALVPTFQRGLESLGVHVDGIGTTPLSGQFSPEQGLGEDARRILQASVEDAYRVFIGRVSESRGMAPERVDNLARGRVWVGSDALDLELVDEIGGLQQAIDAAADLAGLEPGEFGVVPIEPELSLRERLAMSLVTRMQSLFGRLSLSQLSVLSPAVERLLGNLGKELEWLGKLNDPRGLYALCFCDLR
ncbi:MAG TPA: signal peptide peptidase SppA [Chromatiales bacterium]|nr:signal peptide peptidase SppA [Chromatiales bacterium]